MTNQTLTVWCNATFPTRVQTMLQQGIGGTHRLVFSNNLLASNLAQSERDAAAADLSLAAADIAFGQPDPDRIMQLENLRWIHLNSAGYTRYDRDDLRHALNRRGSILTNSSGVYDDPCAQHVLAMMMSLARQLPRALDAQRTSRGWDSDATRGGSRLLTNQTALILGFGHIGRRLVELLLPLRMKLTGVRRRVAGDEPIPVISYQDLNQHLPLADHVINLLPASDSTHKFLSAERIGLLKPQAILYNIGRGTTVDRDALLASLQAGRLAAAYLDVTDPEPLPPTDPLWTAPNCYITPHSAGGHADEMERLVQHFLDNFRRFTSGDTLVDRIA